MTETRKEDLNKNDKKQTAPIGLIILSALSFIPMIGVVFGSISIFISLFNFKRFKILFILGLSGIIFNVIIYTALNYFGNEKRGGNYDKLRIEMNNYLLNQIEREINNYECKFGKYPDKLEDVLLINPNLVIKDPVIHVIPDYEGDSLFYYKASKGSYDLFSIGFDGVAYSDDDIYSHQTDSIN